ncbi:MAG TPA: hypothetical protein V6D22_00790 [Candidatus Obscuribacterales bacterium]
MSEDLMDKRLPGLMKVIEKHCKRLKLMSGDFGKAINRIKVKGFGADLDGLKLEAAKDAATDLELIGMAFDAFKRAAKIAKRSDRYQALYSMGEYDSTLDRTDEPVKEMKRAVDALEDL